MSLTSVHMPTPTADPAQSCQAFADWDETLGLCGLPSIGTAICACVHEHYGERRVCAADAAEIQREDPETFICQPCRDSADPHDCQAFLTFRWDGAS